MPRPVRPSACAAPPTSLARLAPGNLVHASAHVCCSRTSARPGEGRGGSWQALQELRRSSVLQAGTDVGAGTQVCVLRAPRPAVERFTGRVFQLPAGAFFPRHAALLGGLRGLLAPGALRPHAHELAARARVHLAARWPERGQARGTRGLRSAVARGSGAHGALECMCAGLGSARARGGHGSVPAAARDGHGAAGQGVHVRCKLAHVDACAREGLHCRARRPCTHIQAPA